MTIPPIGSALAGLGPEWQIPGVGSLGGVGAADPTGAAGSIPAPDALGVSGVSGVGGTGSGSFGDVLTQQIGKLSDLQDTAAAASQSLADGTATDAASVVTSVEKAQLAMQLAGQIRTRGAEAINDIFHTQI